MCGLVPFGEDCEDPYEIYKIIMSDTPISFPRYFDTPVNQDAKLMIEHLLNKIPEARLGGSFAAMKAHKWFDRFDWDALLNMKLSPPFVPPADKLVSWKEIDKLTDQDIPITQEMEKLASKFKKRESKLPDWHKDF
jgi:cGMP-dependent protein kinase